MVAQGLLYIPDGVAMLVLMAVLVYLRRQSRARDATLWLVGLSFILLEALASDAYRSNFGLRTASHMMALAMFVLAGVTFAWAALKDGGARRAGIAFCICGALPLLVLTQAYGGGYGHSFPYRALTIAGLLAQLMCVAVFVRGAGWLSTAALTAISWWGPMIWFAGQGLYRSVVYWGLGFVYLLVATAMRRMVRRSHVGGAVVVAGFVTYAACLMSHPYVLPTSIAGKLADEIWTMQKFVVTIGLLLVLLDEERRQNHELALNDELTGLPNRRLLDDRLQQAVERSNRYGTSFALFVVDLDGFKAVNDRLGHAQGDLVLREAARRLFGVMRSSDTLARIGGDEFVVLVNEVGEPERCEVVVGLLRNALVRVEGSGGAASVQLSGSVGYAIYPRDAADARTLMMAADRRMYEHKAKSRQSSRPRQPVVA